MPATLEAENFDRGGEGVAYHDNASGNAGGQYRTTEDVDIIASADALGGDYVVSHFPTFPGDCDFSEQAKVAGRASLTSVARDGPTALRLHTEPGDDNVAGSGDMERNDAWLSQAATDGYEGREQWWSHSILFPSDFVVPTWHNYVVFDFHNSAPGDWQANFHVLFQRQSDTTRPGVLTLLGYGGVNSGDGRFEATIGEIEKNVWCTSSSPTITCPSVIHTQAAQARRAR